jgi:type II secretory pathway component PulF
LADHYERFAEVQQKFVSSLIYPAVVACVGVVIIIFFMTYMLPKFMSIFEGMQVQLPAATQMLMGISHLFGSYWWLMILVALALFVLFKRYQSSETGKRAIDNWKMRVPVVGKVVKLNLFGQFARTLATLLHNGVPVLTALKITEQVIPNRILKEAIAKTREEVTDGKTIAQPLARSKIFPQLMLDLLKIGEETGDVPGALQNLANTYENELSIALRVMTNLIEPAMIITMAIGVGFLLFSVLSAMFAITSNIARCTKREIRSPKGLRREKVRYSGEPVGEDCRPWSTPHSALCTPHSGVLTRHSGVLTRHCVHSALRTPHSALDSP